MKLLVSPNFFERQQAARQRSRLYTFQFALFAIPCVAAMFVATVFTFWPFLTALIVRFMERPNNKDEVLEFVTSPMYVGVSGFVCTTLVLWALVWIKRYQLRKSGEYVARKLGAIRLSRATPHPKSLQLHNIAAEMALAAGMPPPTIYLWPEEHVVNALTVGRTPSDAAVFVTRGAVDALSRDEMQALVGYGMSQILNGDMALNSRLAAYLYAFKFAPRVAHWWMLGPVETPKLWLSPWILVWIFFSFWIGLALSILTFPGYLAARLLQAAVGRERQRLADASAVQFTRNAPALEAVLIKTAALGSVPADPAPLLDDLSHCCFATPRRRHVFDTHRSIEKRLLELSPRFDFASLDLLKQRVLDALDARENAAEREVERRRRLEANQRVREALLARIGRRLDVAERRQDPPLSELRDPQDPRARLLALLIDRRAEIQPVQLAAIRQKFGDASMAAVAQLPEIPPLTPQQRTLALDAHLPELRGLARGELRRLAETIQQIDLQGGADVFEYALSRTAAVFIADVLDPRAPHGNRKLAALAQPIETLFAIVASHSSRGSAAAAYQAGIRSLGLENPAPFSPNPTWVRALDGALAQLRELEPHAKQVLIYALADVVRFDKVETSAERELVRAICASLHCPIVRSTAPDQRAPAAGGAGR